MEIREATPDDYDGIWEIFSRVVRPGDTYAFDPQTKKEEMAALWMAPTMKTFVAEDEGEIVGSYFIKPNQPGLGAHVANCGYIVHPAVRGKGIGYIMGLHSLDNARKQGFKSIQFNIVVSTNVVAVRLWEKLGFTIVGTIPQGFNHRELGFVDIYIMHRSVDGSSLAV